MSEEHHKHDNNFKQLFKFSVKDFMKLFYNKLYLNLDKNEKWLALSEDVTSPYRHHYQHLLSHPDGKKYLDRAFLVRMDNLDKNEIILHFEYQSTNDNMDERVRDYHNLLTHTFNKIPIISILIGFRGFKHTTTEKFAYDFSKYGMKSHKSFDYDLINLNDEKWVWNAPLFYNKKNPNPVAIAFWGLMSDNRVIKKDGVKMMLEGHKLLANLHSKVDYPEQLSQPYKFLFDYIYHEMSSKQKNQFEDGLEELKKSDEGERVVELIKVAQRGLHYKSETDLIVEDLIFAALDTNNVTGKEKIIEELNHTYDSSIISRSWELISKDTTGKSLKKYLGIEESKVI
ncbi:hypothetical protein [Metabacillus malikii]|uniref:Transposase (putative) YhgA-like domain-containing protein n=1 Tax=Metabacillus malikii TaxID=1504265 RepID=A0ABT9ZE58_9BACI|nr:hypothetical protein [Metabacillus malikii]MDQ0230106.1 hypothetical protein [Metabacillus malikii]